MQKVKIPAAFILFLLALIITTTSSCRRCMCCTYTIAALNCTKGTNYITVNINNGPAQNIQDSINYYQNQGYAVSVAFIDTSGTKTSLERTCGNDNIQWSQASGNTCVVPTNLGGCF